MAAVAELDDLNELESKLMEFQGMYPEAWVDLRKIIDENKRIGYRNICRMILGDTPAKLKGLE